MQPRYETTEHSKQLAEANERLRTELRALKASQSDLDLSVAARTKDLQGAVRRYETALRGSNVTVFTQDRDLRYTSITNPLFGLSTDQIIGRSDEQILPAESTAAIVALKREALRTGEAQDGEVSIKINGDVRWYDLHVEPLRDTDGAVVGLGCAAVDVTERKQGEAHLRLLMRELTHRSKNLLAVIQGLARQTARHVSSVDSFLEQFGARLQALAMSHDLLVQESWHGASLAELARVYLGHPYRSQVAIDGPDVYLTPEAAQSLGLALHELTTNAVACGGLSHPAGRVALTWKKPSAEETGVELLWSESGGPIPTAPDRHGFGSLMIERNLVRSLDARVDLSFPPEGIRCRIFIPAAHLSDR
jgi:PAS domain S-box-containing protein